MNTNSGLQSMAHSVALAHRAINASLWAGSCHGKSKNSHLIWGKHTDRLIN
jgi:hypothetical protein